MNFPKIFGKSLTLYGQIRDFKNYLRNMIRSKFCRDTFKFIFTAMKMAIKYIIILETLLYEVSILNNFGGKIIF